MKPSDQSAKGLDDYFRKTKAKPSIYWLPLTEEQVWTKKKETNFDLVKRKSLFRSSNEIVDKSNAKLNAMKNIENENSMKINVEMINESEVFRRRDEMENDIKILHVNTI